MAVLVAFTMALTLQMAVARVAVASGGIWWVDDGCGSTYTTYYFAEGPAAYWHGAQYSGGPTVDGHPSCMMWTGNVFFLHLHDI